jgi:hypothetical protein
MRGASFITAVLCAVLLGSTPAPVSADPVRITSGTISGERVCGRNCIFPTHVSIAGDTFSITGFFDPVDISFNPVTPVTQSVVMSLRSRGVATGGSATIDGVSYPQVVFSDVAFPPEGGVLHFPPLTLVGIATLPSDALDVTFPFSVQTGSTLIGFAGSSLLPSQRLFSLDLTGSGTASIQFNQDRSRYAASFVFGANPAPTPEPASLLLCASGFLLANGWRLNNMRSRRRRENTAHAME